MSVNNPTTFEPISIGGVDRSDYALRVETWRTVNSVGLWKAALRNIDGMFNNTFDIQDEFYLNVNGPAATLMQGRVDGPGVTLQGSDAGDIWDEYIILSGYDQAQDLLFHNDFEQLYSDPTQTLDDVLDNVINTRLSGLTNITYAGFGGTPAVGSVEFRRGSGFLSTIQELCQRGTLVPGEDDYLFYVDDVLAFQLGAPGFSNSGVTVTSVAGDVTNNIIGTVDFQRRDGGKIYNMIYAYGKKPQFDAYTEYTASRWSLAIALNWALSDETVTIANIVGNTASIRADYSGAASPPTASAFVLDFADMGQDVVDMSDGEIGFWWRYDGADSAAQACARIQLQDTALNQISFFSGNSTPGGGVPSNVNSTRTLKGIWGWCRAPVGYDADTGGGALPDQWYNMPAAGTDFLWDSVTIITIGYMDAGVSTYPDEMEIDGLRLPFAAFATADSVTGIAEDGTGTMTGSPVTLLRGNNTPTVTAAGTFTITLPNGVIGTATSGGWTITGSPVTLVEGANTITVQPAGAGVININLQSKYRRRPLVVNLPYVRHQLTLEAKAAQLANHHKYSGIDWLKFTTVGNVALRYAGQTVTVNIPPLGLNGDLFYMSSIHHIIEPYADVSSGYGFDWITEVEAIPIDSLVYDMGRLRDGPINSAIQLSLGNGVGQSIK